MAVISFQFCLTICTLQVNNWLIQELLIWEQIVNLNVQNLLYSVSSECKTDRHKCIKIVGIIIVVAYNNSWKETLLSYV